MNKFILLLVLFLLLLSADQAFSDEAVSKPGEKRFFSGMEYYAGFLWGQLDDKPGYRLPNVTVDFNFDLKEATGLKIPPLLQFQIEPFFGATARSKSNIETGTSFLLKLGLVPDTWKFQPFVVGGLGLDYMTLHTKEQATQFNFIETVGVGAHYFFKKNLAFSLQGRIRHLSNADIETPNSGIETYSVLVGLTQTF